MLSKLKIAAGLLAFLFAVLPFVSFTGVWVSKMVVFDKINSNKKLDKIKELETLVLDAKTFGKLKKGNEFELGDCRYDVVSAKLNGEKIILVVYNDTKEKAFKKLGELGEHNNKNTSKFKFNFPDWMNEKWEVQNPWCFETFGSNYPIFRNKKYHIHLGVESPPPEA